MFLKAKAQYNQRHYLSFISQGVNYLNKINTKTNDLNIKIRLKAQYNQRHYLSWISYGVNHLNKINTKTDDLQIKIRLENEISLGVQTHAIDFYS